VYIGRLYLKMKKYPAALKRFEMVARDYTGLGLETRTNQLINETKKRITASEKSNKK
jgi:outer membrane protein assembly factor BamD